MADDEGSIVESNILDCAQWVLCPTDTQDGNAECSKAPHVVNNSWGYPGSAPFFKAAVDAWTKGGIDPVFSFGNAGLECSTSGDPGNNPNSVSVGAITSVNELAPFSSKGPGLNGRRKSDLVTSGDRVRSSVPSESGSAYGLGSGTSMAAPYVKDSVALILSAQTDLSIDEAKIALDTTTDQKNLGATNFTCGGMPDAVWPNNQYGHGRVNVLNVYEGFRPAL